MTRKMFSRVTKALAIPVAITAFVGCGNDVTGSNREANIPSPPTVLPPTSSSDRLPTFGDALNKIDTPQGTAWMFSGEREVEKECYTTNLVPVGKVLVPMNQPYDCSEKEKVDAQPSALQVWEVSPNATLPQGCVALAEGLVSFAVQENLTNGTSAKLGGGGVALATTNPNQFVENCINQSPTTVSGTSALYDRSMFTITTTFNGYTQQCNVQPSEYVCANTTMVREEPVMLVTVAISPPDMVH